MNSALQLVIVSLAIAAQFTDIVSAVRIPRSSSNVVQLGTYIYKYGYSYPILFLRNSHGAIYYMENTYNYSGTSQLIMMCTCGIDCCHACYMWQQ